MDKDILHLEGKQVSFSYLCPESNYVSHDAKGIVERYKCYAIRSGLFPTSIFYGDPFLHIHLIHPHWIERIEEYEGDDIEKRVFDLARDAMRRDNPEVSIEIAGRTIALSLNYVSSPSSVTHFSYGMTGEMRPLEQVWPRKG